MTEAVLTALSLAARKVRNYFDMKLSARGLTLARARALRCLARPRPWTQTELAEELEIERPTAVRLLDGLQKAGLIERIPVPNDRRANHIELTDRAEPLLRILDEVVLSGGEVLLKDIDPDELKTTLKVLSAIADNAAIATLPYRDNAA